MIPQETAMRKALEALETYQRYNKFLDVCNPAIESLQAALAQQATLEGAERAAWQPIETAPHDGTSFMAGWFDGPSNPGCNMRPIKRYVGAWWESNEDYKVRTPTHWMPLPTPPKEQP